MVEHKTMNSFKGSIRLFITLWMGLVILSVLALSAAVFVNGETLERFTRQMSDSFSDVETTHDLEGAVLTACTHDMLWRITGDDQYAREGIKELTRADTCMQELVRRARSRSEQISLDAINAAYQEFRRTAATNPPVAPELLRLQAEKLLELLETYHGRFKTAATRTLRSSHRLDRLIEGWPIILVLLVATIVTAGSICLLRRIVRPTLELSRTAGRFGQGDFNARASSTQDDELGMLCRTFNNMAEDIARRETARLEFIGSVVHDIKNPLLIIGAVARRLQHKEIDRDQQIAWLDRMMKQVQYLDALVHDLMDTVQVGTGRLSLQMQDLDIAALVHRVYREQTETISSHAIVFEGDTVCRVLGDEKRLERVLVNLISNAVKYSPEQTEVVLKVGRRGAWAEVVVGDQGIGIKPEDLKILFQPFGRAPGTKDMVRGTGLGLFTAKKIIEAHGGTIHVTSQSGMGTTVTVLFPLAAA